MQAETLSTHKRWRNRKSKAFYLFCEIKLKEKAIVESIGQAEHVKPDERESKPVQNRIKSKILPV